MATQTWTVAASTDDVNSGSNTSGTGGTGNVSGSDLTNVLLSPGFHAANDYWYVAARFTSVGIPQGATISSASFSLKAQATYASGGTIKFLVKGQAADTTITFGVTGSDNLATAARPRTTAVSASWSLPSVTAGTRYSIDITSVVQEIVNRAGWASGNSIVIIVEVDATTTSGEWQDFYSYDDTANRTTNPPQLTVTWATGTDFPRALSASTSNTAATAKAKDSPRALAIVVPPSLAMLAGAKNGTPIVKQGWARTTLSPLMVSGANLRAKPTVSVIAQNAFFPAATQQALTRTVTASAAHTAAAARSQVLGRALTGSAAHTAAVLRGQVRGLVSSVAATAAAARAAVLGRAPSSSVAHTGTLARLAARSRALAASASPSATLIRLAGLARAGTSSIASSPVLARSGGTFSWNVSAGSGYTDGSPKQLVRTSGDRLYVFAVDCTSYPCTDVAQTIRAYRATGTGIPSAFARQDSAHEPAGIVGWAIAIDGSDVIHVAWTERTTSGGNAANLKYTTYSTSSDLWSGTVETIASSMNTTTDGQGDETVALALDSSGVPHITYLSGNGAARRCYYRNRVGGTWSAATQLDSGATYTGNRRAWHPNLAFDGSGRILAAWGIGAFNHDQDGTLQTVVRSTGGSWGSIVQVASGLEVGIDQCSSLLCTPDGTYHTTVILPETVSGSVQLSYIQYYYSTNQGGTWTANHPGSGTQATHNPALGYAAGKVRIYGHGTPNNLAHGDNLYYFAGDGGSASWGAWTQIVTGAYDSSVNVRWAQFHHAYPGTWDIAYWADAYPNNLYAGTEVAAQTVTKALSSAISTAASLVRGVVAGRAPTASTSHSAALARAAVTGRAVSATVAPGATVARQGVLGRALAASTTPAASLARQAARGRALASSVASSAALARQAVATRALAAGAGITAVLTKAVNGGAGLSRSLAASVASTASVVRQAVTTRATAASTAPGATLARATAGGRVVAGSVAHTAVLVRQAARGRALAASAATAVTLTRQAARGRDLAASTASTATPARASVLGRALASAVAAVVSLAKTVAGKAGIGRIRAAIVSVGGVSATVEAVGDTEATVAAVGDIEGTISPGE